MNIAAPPDAWSIARQGCPKHMAFGPCGGVTHDGACEVPGVGPCGYLAAPRSSWPYRNPGTPTGDRPGARSDGAAAFLRTAQRRPVLVTDLPAAALSTESLRACARELAGATDACLLGDHGAARVQLPPSYRTRLLADEGVPAWPGLNCRDRNRVALEAELAACADAGAVGVHCVTGDHTTLGHRPDAQAVFDLDSTELVELARRRPPLVSVAHAPGTPPRDARLARLNHKIGAGADVVFVDHCGGVEQAADAVAALRDTGFRGPVLVCVPVATDAASAAVLASFAADRLPPGYLDALRTAADPRTAGISAALDLGERILAVSGVDGLNLSGGAGEGSERATARDLAHIGRTLIGEVRA